MQKKRIFITSFVLLALVFSTLPAFAATGSEATSTKPVSGKHSVVEKGTKKTTIAKKDTKKTVKKTKKPAANIQKIAVSGNEYSFSPSQITVKKGTRVKITFTNTGTYPHNFVIDELKVKSATVDPSKKTTIVFTANKTGDFQFYCSVPGHLDKGMKGTLTVQ